MTPLLVVEDDADVRESLVDLLRREGYVVHCASHGAEALEKLQDRSLGIRVVLLDLMMPVMDGEEFMDKLAAQPAALGELKVIIVSAKRDAKKAGTKYDVPVVEKPFNLGELVNRIRLATGAPARSA